ncbi:hypothetical protein PR729_11830 [Providencia rettgeri]|nr:hypothetical protein PR729_11830 [Providencia rettgeri]
MILDKKPASSIEAKFSVILRSNMFIKMLSPKKCLTFLKLYILCYCIFYAVSQMQIEGLILFNHLYLLKINLKSRITSNKVKAACRLA